MTVWPAVVVLAAAAVVCRWPRTTAYLAAVAVVAAAAVLARVAA